MSIFSCHQILFCSVILYLYDFIYLLIIWGCVGSLLLCRLCSNYSKQGLLLSCGVGASHCGGSSGEAQALGVQASEVAAPGLLSTASIAVARGLGCFAGSS